MFFFVFLQFNLTFVATKNLKKKNKTEDPNCDDECKQKRFRARTEELIAMQNGWKNVPAKNSTKS